MSIDEKNSQHHLNQKKLIIAYRKPQTYEPNIRVFLDTRTTPTPVNQHSNSLTTPRPASLFSICSAIENILNCGRICTGKLWNEIYQQHSFPITLNEDSHVERNKQ